MKNIIWIVLYFGAVLLAWNLFLVGLGFGIGGCDGCSSAGYTGLCWFCSEFGQLAYLALAASPVWGLALVQWWLSWKAAGKGKR